VSLEGAQSTAYGREELQTAKQDSTFIAVATNSTEKRDQLERQPEGVYTLITSSGRDDAIVVTTFVETKVAVSTCTCSRPSAAAYVALLTTVEELLQRRRARMPWPLALGGRR